MWEKVAQGPEKYHDYEFPEVSVIIPTFNSANTIESTLDSILRQDYPAFEVIVLDGGSTDRTVEIIKSYPSDRIHLHHVSTDIRYEMLNHGISHAVGNYINILFPGDFYLYHHTLRYMMRCALDQNKPHIVFCGTLLRDGKSEAKILFRKLSLNLLQRGQQPTSLQSMWFRSDVFQTIGKFDPTYRLRGGFEFLCRFCLKEGMTSASTSRVLTDYDLRIVTRQMVLRHFWETLRTLFTYFGPWATFRWLFYQKDIARLSNLWARSVRMAFLGR